MHKTFGAASYILVRRIGICASLSSTHFKISHVHMYLPTLLAPGCLAYHLCNYCVCTVKVCTYDIYCTHYIHIRWFRLTIFLDSTQSTFLIHTDICTDFKYGYRSYLVWGRGILVSPETLVSCTYFTSGHTSLTADNRLFVCTSESHIDLTRSPYGVYTYNPRIRLSSPLRTDRDMIYPVQTYE